jgi:eukaryotic-like serine/threonine-protein kinase
MSVKTGCPELNELEALANGEASDADAPRLQSHLKSCNSCRSAYEALTATTVAIHGNGEVKSKPIGKAAYPFLRPPLEPGDMGRLGNYRVKALLGQGGMGLVFDAEDMTLGRPVALKVMRPDQQGYSDGWARFLLEARTMAKIKHDHLVTIYNAGEEGDVIYFAMELLEGESLESWMKRETNPSIAELMRIAREITSGLACIHQHNLVHRDIKPPNIWLEGPQRRVKILDLGLVREVLGDSGLTGAGIVVGTPDYMSPEQARGDSVDPRTDLFSLGCVLYGLCAGKKPFDGATVTAVLMALASHTPTAPSDLNRRVPRALSDLVMQLLAKDPKERPESAAVVLKWLDKIAAGLQVRAEEPIQRAKPSQPARHKELSPESERRAADISKPPAPHGTWIGLAAVFCGVLLLAFVAGGGFFAWRMFAGGPDGGPKKPPPPPLAGDKVFLSDMPDIAREHWPFKGKKDDKKDDKKDKKKGPKEFDMTVRVNGQLFPKGIFMHPPPPFKGHEEASLTYNLRGQFKIFEAEVSMGDTPDQIQDPCFFIVYGDGKRLWRSEKVFTAADAQKCKLDIKGVDVLKLATTCDGEPKGAHAVWIDPAVSK